MEHKFRSQIVWPDCVLWCVGELLTQDNFVKNGDEWSSAEESPCINPHTLCSIIPRLKRLRTTLSRMMGPRAVLYYISQLTKILGGTQDRYTSEQICFARALEPKIPPWFYSQIPHEVRVEYCLLKNRLQNISVMKAAQATDFYDMYLFAFVYIGMRTFQTQPYLLVTTLPPSSNFVQLYTQRIAANANHKGHIAPWWTGAQSLLGVLSQCAEPSVLERFSRRRALPAAGYHTYYNFPRSMRTIKALLDFQAFVVSTYPEHTWISARDIAQAYVNSQHGSERAITIHAVMGMIHKWDRQYTFWYYAQNTPAKPSLKRILFEHDIDFRLEYRQLPTTTKQPKRMQLRVVPPSVSYAASVPFVDPSATQSRQTRKRKAVAKPVLPTLPAESEGEFEGESDDEDMPTAVKRLLLAGPQG